jgi:hypothetical protein
MSRARRLVFRFSAWLGCVGLALLCALPASLAAEFPFDSELLLDVKPMKGSKRVPSLDIGPKGETAIDLGATASKGKSSCSSVRSRS